MQDKIRSAGLLISTTLRERCPNHLPSIICKTGAIGRRGRLKPVIVTVRIRGLVFVLAGELEILLNVSHENPDDE